MSPGNTLILLDGTYTLQNSGMIEVNCVNSKYASNGTQNAPITIKAQNERQAHLKSDGSTAPFFIRECSYWNIIGLHGSSADYSNVDNIRRHHVFYVNDSHHITLKRILSSHSNRYGNDHAFTINSSSHILIEESEAYFYHRHGYDVFKSHHVTIRRSYANSRGYPDLPDGYESDRNGGDESFVLYASSNSVIENSIAEYETRGFEIHEGTTFDGLQGGQNNKMLGNIHLNGHFGAMVDSREVGNVIHPTDNNLYKDMLIINSKNNAFNLFSAGNIKIENITIYNAEKDGIRVTDKDKNDLFCPQITNGCNFTIINALILNSQDRGVEVVINDLYNWTIEYSNVYGNKNGDFSVTENISDNSGQIQNSTSVSPTYLGYDENKILVYIPSSSNMKGAGKNGADIGANILYRYENGIQTLYPLWNPVTGSFPCGVVVSGINDVANMSCFDVHNRLNVNINTLPEAFGGDISQFFLPVIFNN